MTPISVSRIVDLSIEGLHLYDSVSFYIDKTSTYKPEKDKPAIIDQPYFSTKFDVFKNKRYSEPARIIHKSIIDDLVSFLNLSPEQALENIEHIRQFSLFHDISQIVRILEPDVFVEMIKPMVLKIFLRMREQIEPELGVFYTSHEIGLDYVVIKTHRSLTWKPSKKSSIG